MAYLRCLARHNSLIHNHVLSCIAGGTLITLLHSGNLHAKAVAYFDFCRQCKRACALVGGCRHLHDHQFLMSSGIDHACRLSFGQLKKHAAKAYLLGGEQQPRCKHCHSDTHWGHFCHYRNHGPVCPPSSQHELQQILLDRFHLALLVIFLTCTCISCDSLRKIHAAAAESDQTQLLRGISGMYSVECVPLLARSS